VEKTAQGIERGHLILGPIEPEGRDHLMTVIRVNGKHSVTALCHTGKVVCEVKLNTSGVQGTEPEYRRVVYTPRAISGAPNHGGFLVNRYQGSLDA
jgi:hypothetical protein